MADQTIATLTSSLRALEDERTAMLQRVEVLDRAIDGLRSAVGSLGGTTASATSTAAPARKQAAKRASTKRRPAGPKVGADDLVAALRNAGGSATTAELVDALGVNDGRNLNGARRLAVDAGMVVVDDGTYRLVTDAEPSGTAAADDAAADDQSGHEQGGDDQGGDDQGGDDQGGHEQGGHEQGGDDQGGDGPRPAEQPSAEQASLSDDEWEASSGAATGSDELGRRFP